LTFRLLAFVLLRQYQRLINEKGSTDIDCGWPGMYAEMEQGIAAGTVTEDDIDTALIRAFSVRFELGMFDPVDMVPWSNYTVDNDINTPEAIALAREAAREV